MPGAQSSMRWKSIMNNPMCNIDSNGTKWWYLNDKLHREGGPAIEHEDGTKAWYLNGKLHREDGPAIEYAYGTKWWYLNDRELTEHEFDTQMFIKWVKHGGEELYEKEKYTCTGLNY